MPEPVTVNSLRRCVRCEGDHVNVVFQPLTRPFRPEEAHGIEWAFWAPCPTNGEPILLSVEPNEPGTRRGAPACGKPLPAMVSQTIAYGTGDLKASVDTCVREPNHEGDCA